MLASSIYHGSLPLILEGEELADSPNGSLDTVSFEVVVELPAWRASLASIGIAKGSKLPEDFGYHSIWVQDYKLKSKSSLAATVALACVGLLQNTDKRKTTLTGAASRISIGPEDKQSGPLRDMYGNLVKMDMQGYIVGIGGVPVPREHYPSRLFGDGTVEHPAWSVAVAKFTLASTYFVTTRPDHTLAGTVITPPLDVDLPVSPFAEGAWSDLQFRLNDPSGWVLDSRSIEELFLDTTFPSEPHYLPPPTSIPFPFGLWAVTDQISYYQGADPI